MSAQFVEAAVAAINVYRGRHQVEPLTENRDITKIAQSWAEHLASRGTLSHNDTSYRGDQLGENCAMKWTSDRQDYTGQQVADQWYSEVERYDFSAHTGPKTGHFTQLVWKSSREVGIGRAQSRDGKWFVVANFHPAGNYVGQNAANVLPPRDGKVVLPKSSDDRAKERAPERSEWREVDPSARCGGGFDDDDFFSRRDDRGFGDGFPSSGGGGGGGESVKREIQTETIGSGPDAVTRTTTIETRTGPDGRTTTSRTVRETRGAASACNTQRDDSDEPRMSGLSLRDKKDDKGTKPTPSQQTDKQFIKDVLRCHNVCRSKHGPVGALSLNDELTSLAQQWAEELAAIRTLKHSNEKYNGQPVGENVAAKSGSGHVDYTGQEVVDQWYSESSKFDYSQPEGRPGVSTGHFSQVVWKSSRELGVGKAKSSDGRQAFVVCMYAPAGNYIGRYKENVLPPH